MNTSLALTVADPSQAGEARRLAAGWAADRGCDAELSARLALVVTELGKNLALHTTQGGRLILRRLGAHEPAGVEILSIDRGPGVANFGDCLRDGYSTAGTAGIGLGGVERASQVFQVHSKRGAGTVLLSQLWVKTAAASSPETLPIGGVSIPQAGETMCGDCWAVQSLRSGATRLMVADGLGHGPNAAVASRAAVEVFRNAEESETVAVMERMHDALRGTRGATVAIAEIDAARTQITHVGIGNIASCLVADERTTSFVSLNGTVGATSQKPRAFTYPAMPGALVVMSSDGLKTPWQLSGNRGLLERHPSVIAGVLYRDYDRGTDDTTVVAVRLRK